jgi:hypothetical protein
MEKTEEDPDHLLTQYNMPEAKMQAVYVFTCPKISGFH